MGASKADQGSIYQLKVTINHIRPPIWRRLQVAGKTTFASLHDILQTAFGWDDSHLHQFVVRDAFYAIPVPGDDWGAPTKDSRQARLEDVVGRQLKKFVYEYDFGDGWEHAITVEKILPAEAGVTYPRCLTGRRAGPPEDCGGPWGYTEMLEAVSDPNNPDADEMREWLGDEFDPEEFNLDIVNVLLKPREAASRRR